MAKKKSDILMKMMPILTILVVLSVAVGAYFVLFLPKIGAFSGASSAAFSELEAQISSDEKYLDDLDKALSRYALLNTQLRQKTQAIMPLEQDTPGLFVQIDGVAREHNFVITAVSMVDVEDSIGAEGQSFIKVTANVEGGDYKQFTAFLSDLERSERLIDVKSVVFTPLAAKYSIVMNTYYLDPDAELEDTDPTLTL